MVRKPCYLFLSFILLFATAGWANDLQWVPLNGVQAVEEAPALELKRSNMTSIDLSVTVPGFHQETVQTNVGTFSHILLADNGVTGAVGHPQLPAIRRWVEIPYGAIPELIVGRTVMRQDDLAGFGLSHRLMPTQPPIEKVPGALEAAQFVIDEDSYATSGYQVGEFARLSDIYHWRGHQFVMLEVFPFDYSPADEQLRVLNEVEIQIALTGSDMSRTRQMKERYEDPYTHDLAHRLFINAGTLDQTDLIPAPMGYLIVTNNHYASLPILQDFVAWKTQKGFHVTVATTESIGSTTTLIKNYIQDAYNNWPIPPCFVQLVGDVDVIPEWTGSGSGSPHTDIYYGTLEGGDAFADVGVGRFSPATDTELANMINKVLSYEQVDWTGNDDWEKHAVFMASTDNYQISEGTHNYVIENYLAPDGYRCDRLYTVTYSATTAQVSAAINEGRSLAVYSGHGSVTSWADGPPFSQTNVRNLTNTVYPVVCSFACLTGQFQSGECFGETWSRVEHGALAFWGSTVTSYWDEDDILEKRIFQGFFDVQWPQEEYNLTWTSGFLDYGKYELWQYYGGGSFCLRYDEMYNILGDASVDIWTDIPQQLTVNYPGAVLIGVNQLDVTVSGYPDWALVHIYSDAEDMIFTEYVTNGTASFNLGSGFTVPGNLEIWVTGHDCEPYHGTASIIPPSGPYVISGSVDIVDAVIGWIPNGQLDYNETVKLTLTMENVGIADATDVTVTISEDEPVFSINDNTEYYGNIPAGGSVSIAEGFEVHCGGDPEDGYVFTVDVTATSGTSQWESTFTLTAHAPFFTFELLEFDDPLGNNNGWLDPGETADMTVTVRNTGSSPAFNSEGILYSQDPLLTVNSNTSTYGELQPDATASATFNVTADPSTPQEHLADAFVALSYDPWLGMNVPFQIMIGNVLYNPTGPDGYGYVAYDPFDAPENPQYDWMEVCADSGGPGTLVNFTQDDQTFQLDLPFGFQYYGQAYTRYTIGANGWIAMGEVAEDDYSNSGIPNGDGPAAMIAPYWEDLSPQRTNSGRVWQYYDSADHRLIVEWNHIEQYSPTGSFETFQVILLDPAYYPTSTNDGRILFQYKDMSAAAQTEGTVGIENPAETIGLQILFDGSYDQYVHPIENGMAILFSTPTSAPNMAVDVTYVSGSPVPAGGGDLTYDLYVENTGSSAASFDGWLYVSYEGGDPTTLANRSFTGFMPGWTINRTGMVFPVPGSYAAGNYTFGARTGVHPSTIYAEDSIPFVKSGTNDQTGFVPFLPEFMENPFDQITGMADGQLDVVPDVFSLSQNYPNPFNPVTTLSFSLPQAAHVTLAVFNVNGQLITELVDGMRDAGVHEISFDASHLSSGMYFYRIEAGDFSAVRKMILLK